MLFALMLISCGRQEESNPVVTVDSDLQVYLNRFLSEVGGDSKGLSATFTNLSWPVVGQCTTYGPVKTVHIDSTYWKNINDDAKEQESFHEFSHCLLGRVHTANTLSDGCPQSIMYPTAFGDPCYTRHRQEYIQELRNYK